MVTAYFLSNEVDILYGSHISKIGTQNRSASNIVDIFHHPTSLVPNLVGIL